MSNVQRASGNVSRGRGSPLHHPGSCSATFLRRIPAAFIILTDTNPTFEGIKERTCEDGQFGTDAAHVRDIKQGSIVALLDPRRTWYYLKRVDWQWESSYFELRLDSLSPIRQTMLPTK